ncbi:MAG: 30S ribosomal protein S3 [Patescibacteria group bacterium]
MTHKVHPKIFRIRKTEDWDSRWFEKKNYAKFLQEDFRIRDFLEKKLKDSGVENIEIERFAGKISIIIKTARPGLIIGRGGSGIEELKRILQQKLLQDKGRRLARTKDSEKKEIHLEIQEIKNPWESSSLVAQWIVQQTEKRMPFRRVLKQALTKVMANKGIQGVKFRLAGRLDGAEIARVETMRKGRLPLQTLRADIDYAHKEAYTTYGVIGVKVWLYKGEKFE